MTSGGLQWNGTHGWRRQRLEEGKGSGNNEKHNRRWSKGMRVERHAEKKLFSRTWDGNSIHVGSRTIARDSQPHHKSFIPLDLLKELPAVLQVDRSPELLVNYDGAHRLGFRLPVLSLSIPQIS